MTFEDKISKGCWFGFNKHFGITAAYGPYANYTDIKQSKDENFEINKTVLQKAKSVEEATKLYKKLFLEQKIDKSFNLIICDSNSANVMELVQDKIHLKTENESSFRTNSFLFLKGYDKDPERVEISGHRLTKVLELVKNVQKAEDIIPILKFHSKNNKENVCRHDYGVTVGSVILELKGNEVIIYHLLNKSPCKGEYEKEVIKLES